MSNEEFERAIDFLLKSQATSDARIQQLNEQMVGTDGRVSRLTDQVTQLTEQVSQIGSRLNSFADTQGNIMIVMTRTYEAQDKINESLRAAIVDLAAKQGRTEMALAKLIGKVDGLAEQTAGTDRRLDALIKIVEERHGSQ